MSGDNHVTGVIVTDFGGGRGTSPGGGAGGRDLPPKVESDAALSRDGMNGA